MAHGGLGETIIPFAIAPVLLAPFVEEKVYRGSGIIQHLPRFGVRATMILSSLFFGLFHWSGGYWYILITAIIVGIPLRSCPCDAGTSLSGLAPTFH